MSFKFTCSRCGGAAHSTAKPDRIDGRPVCGPCFWAPAPPAPSPASPPPAPAAPPAAVVALPRCASFADLDPDERRALRRAA